jgi:phosphoglycolate phosphatase
VDGHEDKPHLILFDCDGTLTDSHGAIVKAMQQAFVANGRKPPADDAVERVIGLSLMGAIEKLTDERSLYAGIGEAYRDHYVAAEASLKLYPGVVETLETLKQRGYWMGIVTGKSKAGLLRVLEQFGLDDFFYVIRTADCCPSKPHPAMALECMAELGIEAEKTALVGDALFDMQMAMAASVRAIGVSFGVESADSLAAAGAKHVVDHFPALLECFPPLNSAAVELCLKSGTMSTKGVA